MFYSVDRIDGDTAVCIGDMGETFAVKLALIDGSPREGSVLFDMGTGRYLCSSVEEDKRREENARRLERLFEEEN